MKLLSFASFFYYICSFCREGASVACPARPSSGSRRRKRAGRLDEQGLAMDFHDLKKFLREVLDQLEHTFLNDIFPFTQINPSSENLAKWIYDNMVKKINNDNLDVASVTVWESDTASASYFE